MSSYVYRWFSDTAPFPAITLCNLNPYKASLATSVDLVKRTLSAFDGAMGKAGGSKEGEGEKEEVTEAPTTPAPTTKPARRRGKRDLTGAFFEPGFARCLCGSQGSSEQEDKDDEKEEELRETTTRKSFNINGECCMENKMAANVEHPFVEQMLTKNGMEWRSMIMSTMRTMMWKRQLEWIWWRNVSRKGQNSMSRLGLKIGAFVRLTEVLMMHGLVFWMELGKLRNVILAMNTHFVQRITKLVC